MKTYKLVNNIVGWIVFAVAACTYCLTIEPTASFWDCPEFISSAAKLEVGHPPGAPFFMLLGNLFTQFASDATQVSKMVNTMSALLSAGCILFLFWSITYLAKKLISSETVAETIGIHVQKDDDGMFVPSVGQTIAIMASGVAGALIYTWSDTFWFSAVEGEVYAFSSFLTALVFWLILKWEQSDIEGAGKAKCDRWLILIAYLMGLSIGVHLLNLLCIPAMVLVYYFRKVKNPNGKGSLLALGVSVIIIAAVLYGIVPGIGKVGGWFELLFVNSLGMSYNTGLYIYLAVLVAALVWAIVETTRGTDRTRMNISFLLCVALLGIPFYGYGVMSIVIGIIVLAIIGFCIYRFKQITPRGLNTTVLCLALIVVGYSSYAVIVIRSAANPMMDENSPEDVFSLGQYLGREQYGDRPLFYGQTFMSQREIVQKDGGYVYNYSEGEPVRQRKNKKDPSEKDEYVVVRENIKPIYPSNQCMLFPRIYDEGHAGMYRQWLGEIHTKSVTYELPGHNETVQIPTQQDNMKFFLSYQMNFMYWRYFMWNFAGRQNDVQGMGELEHGNWLTGFSAIDNARLGDQSLLPTELKENKGHNVFYCLPLIIGLIGFFWQAFRGKKGIQQFWVVFFLFFMTGIAIVLYLNQTPGQPRERDYAYAGSFYAFSIWCGLGITAVYSWFENWLGKNKGQRFASVVAGCISVVPALAIPLQMVSQTWDDHDRSNRYMCRDFGLNYLETIPQDGIIFTNGDNDTFPLWYNCETEGNRTDVRVCNLSYLQTDWYIDQMKRPAFSKEQGQSSPLPISWTRDQYTTGKNERILVNPDVPMGDTGRISMKDLVRMMYEQNPEMARAIWGDEPFELKTAIKKFVLKEDIPAEYADLVATLEPCLPSDTLYVNVDKEAVRRSGMMIPNDSIPDRMYISLEGQPEVYKNFIMMLEMLAQSNFSRPMYMACTVGPSNFGNLYRHFVQEGLAWRFTPFTFDDNSTLQIVCDADKSYDNLMNKYQYGNLKQKGLYIDETVMRMCWTHRRVFANTIQQLIAEGKNDKALKALKQCEEEIPEYNVPYDAGNGSLELAQSYLDLKQYDKAKHIFDALEKKSLEYIRWYESLPDGRFKAAWRSTRSEIYTLATIQDSYDQVATSAEGKVAEEWQAKSVNMMTMINELYGRLATRAQALGEKI